MAAAAPTEKIEKFTHLYVAARRHGFRRAGRAWPKDGVTVPKKDFDAKQIEALLNEEHLVVKEVPEPK